MSDTSLLARFVSGACVDAQHGAPDPIVGSGLEHDSEAARVVVGVQRVAHRARYTRCAGMAQPGTANQRQHSEHEAPRRAPS